MTDPQPTPEDLIARARAICAEARPDYASGFLSGEYDQSSTEMRAVMIALQSLSPIADDHIAGAGKLIRDGRLAGNEEAATPVNDNASVLVEWANDLAREIDSGEIAGGISRVLPNGKRYVLIDYETYERDLLNRFERGKRFAIRTLNPSPPAEGGDHAG